VGETGWADGIEGTAGTEGGGWDGDGDCDEGRGGADTGWDEDDRLEAGGGACGAEDQGGWAAPNL
jgi:hypothetical protein